MRKHAIQLAELLEKQKDERERYLIEYQKKVAKDEREKQEKKAAGEPKYVQLKTNSCESITHAATCLLRAAQELDSESVSGCFGMASNSKTVRSPGSPTKRRQALLDPIRRWNSFHMRDRKTNPSVVKSFEQFRKDYLKKTGTEGGEQPPNPSMAAAGLMGALPRVLALRNESLVHDIAMTDNPGNVQSKKQMSLDVEPVEKTRALSQGDVGKTLTEEVREGMTLTRQVTRELLLAAKRNSCKELLADGKGGKQEKDTIRYRKWSEGDDEEREKPESPKKLVRKKTKEKLSLSASGEKPRRWSDKEEVERAEVEARNAISARNSTSSDYEEDDSDW